MLWIFWLVFAYFLGSIPFGLFIGKICCNIDIRTEGSKSTGATNVARLCGFKYGMTALILDIAKGFIPVLMASQYSHNWLFLSLVALSAVIGHVFSMFMDMKGGKAVATTIGVFLVLAPAATFWAVALCAAVIFLSGYVSMGSLTLAITLPVFALITGSVGAVPLGCILTLMLFWTHRSNISRLAKGEEISWKKK
ncbi:glycerol-3-phosphate 1-O-acyltransferase PlsY [Maridesulfovibrio hydrothermalis]|uniref:Glycerol-3-phosphate acyltransferase n=1 Tax=Maridesulfovibrio hydrothermalis AM13 = DSM 14728 TaxID=1121451 RepID=L0RHM8_9BACT|nr:glycerol-3-phosphate 1-O-acyltransferase PlsY [Maridesulfovibrio hydrothermalis]CCO25086.1 Glycerol-3-phosphate acyltransferase [Maridesulfovibrio hydrothermalis AM13 = DSM 14728]